MPRPVARSLVLGIAAMLGLLTLARPVAAQQPAAPDRKPIDLVIVVDVSYSMFYFKDSRTDPGGIRWDAIQFLIDTASPDDRVALVLYRADAALVSRHLASADSRSGFVTLGSGPDSPRVKLKEMIAGFQKFEEDIPRNDNKADEHGYPIPGQKEPLKFSGGGTGSLLALQAVWEPKWNLDFQRDRRQPLVMLFTDGMDTSAGNDKDRADNDTTTDSRVVWGKPAFNYVRDGVEKEFDLNRTDKKDNPKKLGEKAAELLKAEVVRVADRYRHEGVPLFTFGLTNPKATHEYEQAAMRLTLRGLADGSIAGTQDLRFARLDLFNQASSNVELFRQLQDVTWQLRERWLIKKPPARGRSLSLTTPERQFCDDLGVLLYRKDGDSALAPDSTTAEATPLRSRSHHYVSVPTTGTGPSTVQATFPADSDQVAILGMRLRSPLLKTTEPSLPEYKTLDAIPIEVAFDPRDSKFTRDMFTVVATLRPPGGDRPLTIRLQPADWSGVPNGWVFEGHWVPEEHGRRAEVIGNWLLDIVVTIDVPGARSDETRALSGATRALPRQKVLVGEKYPTLQGPAGVTTITNLGDKAGKGELKFTVKDPPIAAKGRPALLFDSELVPSSPSEAAWKGNKVSPIGRVPLHEGSVTVPVDLSKAVDFDWSALPKDGTKATVAVRAPWAKDTPVKGEVAITKEPYALEANVEELLFNLSGNTATDMLPVSLKTRLNTTERVTLSGQKDKPSTTLEVKLAGKTVNLIIAKGTDVVPLLGGKDTNIAVQINRTKEQEVKPDQEEPEKGNPIAPGEYVGKVYILPADERSQALPAEVKVRVLVKVPELRLRNILKPKDPAVPVSRLRLTMLAGTKTVFPLEMGIVGPADKQQILAIDPQKPDSLRLRVSRDPATQIPLPIDWFKRDNLSPARFTVSVDVPKSVREGPYRTSLLFDVKADDGRDKDGNAKETSYTVRRPVEIEVHRFAVVVDADLPLNPPKPTEDRRLVADRTKYPSHDAGLELTLNTPFSDKDLPVRWWAKLVETTPMPEGKGGPLDRWFDGRIDVRELTDAGPGQPVLGTEARTVPVSKLAEQRLVVLAQNLYDDKLPPGVYRCKIRVYGTLDAAKPKSDDSPEAETPHFDLPISVLVRGRVLTADRQLGENKVLVGVTCYGSAPGTGQIRTPDVPVPPRDIPSETPTSPDAKLLKLKPIEVTTGPGLTRYVVYWPKKAADVSPPKGAEPTPDEMLSSEVRFWQKPKIEIDQNRRVGAAGDKISFRIPITPGTFDILTRPAVARVTHNGATVEDVTLTEDRGGRVLTGSFTLPTGTPLPPAGEYTVALVQPLIAQDKKPDGTDQKDLKPDPVTVTLGLEVRKEERIFGPLIYGGGFFSSDVVTDPGLLHVTNHTLHDMKYTVAIRYPSARTADPKELDAAKGEFVPSVHLEFKPTIAEGTLKPGETVDLGAEVGLSPDALDAYLNDREHPTFKTKNGALLVVTMKGTGADGQEFTWEQRHPLVVETQSWRNRGLLLGLVAAVAGGFLVWYAYRKYRRWAIRQQQLKPAPSDEPSPPRTPEPPDDGPALDNVFGSTPPA